MNLILATVCAVFLTQVNGDITGRVTCDNFGKFYVDGVLETNTDRWPISYPVSFPDTAGVLAFDCLDVGVIGGLRGEFSNGIVTDSSWRCSTSAPEGWNNLRFDDSSWEDATVQTHNNWGSAPRDLSANAQWIWTSGDTADRHVFCRRRLHPNTCVPGDETLVVDPNNCRRFRQCLPDGTYISMPCAPGTGFLERIQRCEHLNLLPNCN